MLALRRDGLPVDARLTAALERDAVDVTTGPGDGYSAMTSHPQRSVVPEETFARVQDWLSTRPLVTANGDRPVAGATMTPTHDAAATPAARPHAELVLGGRAVGETPLRLTRSAGGTVSGVLTTSDADGPLCAVFLNAGGVRRIGPNRMWVEAARRWAARGVPSLRLDAIGIGESDGAPTPYAQDGRLYQPEFVPDVIDALDELQRRGVAERFLLIGLCAGAYWSLYAGIEDPRVAGMALLNPVAIVWDNGIECRSGPATRVHRALVEAAAQERDARAPAGGRGPRRVGAAPPVRAASHAAERIALGSRPVRHHARAPARLRQARHDGVRRARAPARRARTGRLAATVARAPQIDLLRIPVNDHTFRPTVIQAQIHAALDDALAASERAVTDGAPVLTARP